MPWNELRHRRPAVPQHVVHRTLAEETVFLNVQTSTYHTVDAIGARFFECMLASPTIEQACVQLAEEYEQPLDRITADMEAFCRDLQERGLIELRDADVAAS